MTRPSQTKRHEMKNKCRVYTSALLLCTYVTSAVGTFGVSLDLQPKDSRQQMAADGWKVVCMFVESKGWPRSTLLENSCSIRQSPRERLLYFFCLRHFSESLGTSTHCTEKVPFVMSQRALPPFAVRDNTPNLPERCWLCPPGPPSFFVSFQQ